MKRRCLSVSDMQLALIELKRHRSQLTKQQAKTLAGQVKAGQIMAAMKGLNKILARNEV